MYILNVAWPDEPDKYHEYQMTESQKIKLDEAIDDLSRFKVISEITGAPFSLCIDADWWY